MSKKEILNRILIKGGILTPIEMIRIIELLSEIGLSYFHFGSRQDILFEGPDSCGRLNDSLSNLKVQHCKDKKFQNIVSSYLSADIFHTTTWLTAATYLYILEEFQYNPVLKISIVDPKQQIVPLFYSQLNFIASDHEDYWYLYIRMPETGLDGYFPVLIFSYDLPKIALYIENNYRDFESIEELFTEAMTETRTKSRVFKTALRPSYVPFPYYEGMNKMGIDSYWLGLYWRNNHYDMKFLRAMCDLCIESKVGKICITPWKSFIIKGIPAGDKLKWEKFLGYSGINVRHSSLELNWHLPVGDADALDLKNYIVGLFDSKDVSTYGLTFSITSVSGLDFTSIIIRENPRPSVSADLSYRPSYNIIHCKNFDPNTQAYETYCQDVDKMEIPPLLLELSKKYYDQLGQAQPGPDIMTSIPTIPVNREDIFQCRECLTIYDSRYGDPSQDVPENTLFQNLDPQYQCPVCQSPKEDFLPYTHTDLIQVN